MPGSPNEAYRAHKSGKGRFVAWEQLAEQMGADYAEVTNFQQKAVATLRKIEALYPALKLGPLRGGSRIEPDSLPAITPRPPAAIEQPARLAPVDTDEARKIRQHLMAAAPQGAWRRAFDEVRAHLKQAAEAGDRLQNIKITFRNGAVLSLTPAPYIGQEPEIDAAELIYEGLRELLDE